MICTIYFFQLCINHNINHINNILQKRNQENSAVIEDPLNTHGHSQAIEHSPRMCEDQGSVAAIIGNLQYALTKHYG